MDQKLTISEEEQKTLLPNTLTAPTATATTTVTTTTTTSIPSSGNVTAPTPAQMAKIYQLAADGGDTTAKLNLGSYYEKGYGVEKNIIFAAQHYQSIPKQDQNFAEAQKALKKLLLQYPKLTQHKILSLSLDNQLATIMNDLLLQSISGKDDYQIGNAFYIESQYKKSFSFFEKSAKAGYPGAYLRLYQLHKQLHEEELGATKGIQKINEYWNKTLAHIDWFKTEANKREAEADAQYNLGIIYQEGEKALLWCKLAADQGYSPAEHHLGLVYYRGMGVEQNFREAIRYFRLAANKGNTEAQYALASCYAFGHGVDKNLTEAMKYSQLAADGGLASAQYHVGLNYLKRGSSQEAVKYLRLAENQGYSKAKDKLEEINAQKDPFTPIFSPLAPTMM